MFRSPEKQLAGFREGWNVIRVEASANDIAQHLKPIAPLHTKVGGKQGWAKNGRTPTSLTKRVKLEGSQDLIPNRMIKRLESSCLTKYTNFLPKSRTRNRWLDKSNEAAGSVGPATYQYIAIVKG
jgi:hypothetical protein